MSPMEYVWMGFCLGGGFIGFLVAIVYEYLLGIERRKKK